MSKPRNIAFFRVNNELIREALHMPKGTVVHRVAEGEVFDHPDSCVVLVQHPDLPCMPDDTRPEEVRPVVTRRRKFVIGWREELEWDWGLP